MLKFSIAFLFVMFFTPNIQAQIDLNIIRQIESSGGINLYGSQGELGEMQISPICLKDYIRFSNLSLADVDLMEPGHSKKIAGWYIFTRLPQLIKSIGYPVTERNLLIAWNCGYTCLKRDSLPEITRNYLIKYKKLKERS